MSRDHWIKASNEGYQVTKVGARTGRTTGKWLGTAHKIPEVGTAYDRGRNFGVVEWKSPDQPFALSGDSGALVKLEHGGKVVPLGIHQGSVDNLSFYTWQGDICMYGGGSGKSAIVLKYLIKRWDFHFGQVGS